MDPKYFGSKMSVGVFYFILHMISFQNNFGDAAGELWTDIGINNKTSRKLIFPIVFLCNSIQVHGEDEVKTKYFLVEGSGKFVSTGEKYHL
jgi:hypothetical protein